MAELVCNIPNPRNAQELEQAIRRYKTTDLSGNDLFCLWQAIRDAALALASSEGEGDRVSGESSY